MSDSLERLYQAVLAAKDLDPAISRTARLFQRGPAKMAKKLAEEAIEVVIDAVNGKPDAVIRESHRSHDPECIGLVRGVDTPIVNPSEHGAMNHHGTDLSMPPGAGNLRRRGRKA